MRRTTLCALALLAVLPVTPPPGVAASGRQASVAAPASPECSLTWIGHEDEIETFLASGTVIKTEDLPVGVTRPQRATLAPGPVGSFTWKPLMPGVKKGYRESYKAEIAAYRLDRLLGLHMVPPIVERELDGRTGAAVMWIENTHGWNAKQPPQGPQPLWNLQLTRMKMFDLLIANIDRNQGNLIYDADWHLFLIDHSRAFTKKKDLKGIAPLVRVDRQLWDKMAALTPADIEMGLGNWLGTDDLDALLMRRDRMATMIKDLIAKHGEKNVFYD